eukprot:TRINITY_DN13680_c0_g2_i11.p1 TRINITY_DN13680_c0_g2~~TRINITY_DN13680_c0_g2_i11.p1  ORF type:complete len:726 (-),score=192.73 TRINITY_DN13680_c0_g2_i11:135-2312(-)
MKSGEIGAKSKITEERRREILNNLQKERELRRKRAEEMPSQAYSTKTSIQPSNSDRKHVKSRDVEELKTVRGDSLSESERFNQFLLHASKNKDSPAAYQTAPGKPPTYNERIQRFIQERTTHNKSKEHESKNPSATFNRRLKADQELRNKHYANPKLPDESKRDLPLSRPSKNAYMQPTETTEIKRLHAQGLPPTALKAAREKEERVRKECTFKPQISRSQYEEKLEQNREERLTRLYEPKIAEVQQREKLKRLKDDEEFHNTCTFQPQSFAFDSKGSSQPVGERLYTDATQRLDKLKRGFRDRELKRLKDCTFKPDIERSSQSVKGNRISSKPIYDRFKDIQRERGKLMQTLKAENETSNKNLTFRPSINRSINVSHSSIDESVADRLYKDAERRHEKSLRLSKLAPRSAPYSFTPRLHRSTYSVEALGDDRLLSKRFEERQELYAQRRRDNEVQRMAKYSTEVQFPFRPQIDSVSEAMVETNSKRALETPEEKFKRLHEKDPKKQEKIKMMREYEGRYSHHPRINESSRLMAQNRRADPSDQPKPKHIEVSVEERKECTFQPHINSSQVNSRYSQRDNIMGIIRAEEQERAKNLEQRKRELEYEELKACTFRPETGKVWEQPEPVEVKGIKRYLELQEKKRKNEKDLKEREQAAFDYGEKYDKHGVRSTTPKPFKLSKGKTKVMKKEEFTFHPETNRNKGFLKDLVKQSASHTSEEYTKEIHS